MTTGCVIAPAAQIEAALETGEAIGRAVARSSATRAPASARSTS